MTCHTTNDAQGKFLFRITSDVDLDGGHFKNGFGAPYQEMNEWFVERQITDQLGINAPPKYQTQLTVGESNQKEIEKFGYRFDAARQRIVETNPPEGKEPFSVSYGGYFTLGGFYQKATLWVVHEKGGRLLVRLNGQTEDGQTAVIYFDLKAKEMTFYDVQTHKY